MRSKRFTVRHFFFLFYLCIYVARNVFFSGSGEMYVQTLNELQLLQNRYLLDKWKWKSIDHFHAVFYSFMFMLIARQISFWSSNSFVYFVHADEAWRAD